jgi:hypothetical protein
MRLHGGLMQRNDTHAGSADIGGPTEVGVAVQKTINEQVNLSPLFPATVAVARP